MAGFTHYITFKMAILLFVWETGAAAHSNFRFQVPDARVVRVTRVCRP